MITLADVEKMFEGLNLEWRSSGNQIFTGFRGKIHICTLFCYREVPKDHIAFYRPLYEWIPIEEFKRRLKLESFE